MIITDEMTTPRQVANPDATPPDVAPLVSVIMNCYNGERYLREAIDSIFAQTYANWEIVFIDNCSTDGSAAIARSYGARVRYFRTAVNVRLGAARAFAVERCEGDYIAILDVDDSWLPDFLDIMVHEMRSGGYALAYAGQFEMDGASRIIGKAVPRAKRGYLLPDLLRQFDAYLPASVLCRKQLLAMRLTFDSRIVASEEYCLFMQIAARATVCSLARPLVRYRILSNSLTVRAIRHWALERFYTIRKIIQDNPGVSARHRAEFAEAITRGIYYRARYLVRISRFARARTILLKCSRGDIRYRLMGVMLWIAPGAWAIVHYLKNRRQA